MDQMILSLDSPLSGDVVMRAVERALGPEFHIEPDASSGAYQIGARTQQFYEHVRVEGINVDGTHEVGIRPGETYAGLVVSPHRWSADDLIDETEPQTVGEMPSRFYDELTSALGSVNVTEEPVLRSQEVLVCLLCYTAPAGARRAPAVHHPRAQAADGPQVDGALPSN